MPQAPAKQQKVADMDAHQVGMLKKELDRKMPAYLKRGVEQEIWKHPMLTRNPSVQMHFKTLYRKYKKSEFQPIR